MDILASFLQGPLKVAFQKSLSKADDGDKIITKEEFEVAKKAFFKTDEFKGLSSTEERDLKKKLDADTLWEKQGAAAVTNYDGMEKQIEHYEKLLAAGKVTKKQLDFAKQNGFGDIDGKNGIDGLELAVADLDGNKRIGAKDGDLNGDGKVNKDDRGIDLGSSSKSNKGLDQVVAFIEKLIKIWAPQSAGNTSAAQQAGTEISKALGEIKRIMEAAKTRTTTTPTP
jgi:hypothetical protein